MLLQTKERAQDKYRIDAFMYGFVESANKTIVITIKLG